MNSVLYCMDKLADNSKLHQMDSFIQHGETSCLKHTIAVAYYSLKLAKFLRIKCKERELIRGALLHDYFLYDWHVGGWSKLHGFTHPKTALKNAEVDFSLTDRERDIIKKHMFPLTLFPPKCREGWLVCMVDKGCSLYETFKKKNAYSKVKTKSKEKYEKLFEEIQII